MFLLKHESKLQMLCPFIPQNLSIFQEHNHDTTVKFRKFNIDSIIVHRFNNNTVCIFKFCHLSQ